MRTANADSRAMHRILNLFFMPHIVVSQYGQKIAATLPFGNVRESSYSNTIRNVVVRPGTDLQDTLPPYDSAIAFTRARPSPFP